MAITVSEFKINGFAVGSDPVEITPDGFSASWTISQGSSTQSSIDLRISSSNASHGTNGFGSEILRFTGVPAKGRIQKVNFRRLLSRNQILFGQIRLNGSDGSQSSWVPFRISIPTLPFVQSATLTPSSPKINDVINLNYTLSPMPVAGVEVRWYKNGIEQYIIKNNRSVPVSLLSPGDVWKAEVRPYNRYNEGIVFTTTSVEVSKPVPAIDQLEIVPRDATVDDILEVVYSVSDSTNNYKDIDDETSFDWFVNDVAVAENYGRFARLRTNPGDKVYVRAKPKLIGFESGSFISDSIFIKKSEVTIRNILIDGQIEGGTTYNPSPVVTWEVDPRYTSDISGFTIKLGTVNGSDEFGSFPVSGNTRSFKIASSLISSGSEYVITIIPVTADGVNGFAKYAKFKTNGSLWRDNVNNQTGWTIACKLSITAEDSEANSGYAMIVSDGKYTFRIELYKSLTRVIANSRDIVENIGDNSLASSFVIGVQGNSLMVFRNGASIFNIANALVTESTERTIRFEPIVVVQECSINLYDMFISVLGRKVPGDSDYGKVSFYRFASLPNTEISALAEYGGKVLIGATNQYPKNYPSLYEFNPVAPSVECDISSFNNTSFVINNVASSRVGDVVGIGTSRGVTTVKGGNPSRWDSFYEYSNSGSLNTSGWTQVYDNNTLITFPENRIRINTKPVTSSQKIPLISDGKIRIISIQQKGVIQSYTFSYNSTRKLIIATRNPSFPNLVENIQFVLSDEKTIEQLVAEILSTNVSSSANTDTRISFLYDVVIMNEYGSIASSFISSITVSTSEYAFDFYASASELGMVGSDGVLNDLPSASRGSAYIEQSSIGTAWYESVEPSRGYTFEVDMSVSSLEEALDSSDDSNLSNLSFSDGSYSADVQVFDSFIKHENTKVSIDMTEGRKLRFSSKNGQVKVYDMDSSESQNILSFSMKKLESDVGEFVSAKSVTVDNDVHVIGLMSYGEGSNFYHRVYSNGSWIDYGKLFSKNGDFGNFDVAFVKKDLVVAFEIAASGRGEIAVARKSPAGWSEPLRITSSIGESKNPRIVADDNDGLHLVWEDNRDGVSRICYASQSGGNFEWRSSAFGQEDLMITSSSNASYHPGIIYSNGYIYIVYQSVNIGTIDQQSSINMVSKSLSTGSWTGYAGSSAEMQISNVLAISPKNPFISSDNEGRIHVVWIALQGTSPRFRVHHRYFNPQGTTVDNTVIVPLANEPKDSEIYSLGFDSQTNFLIVSMIKKNLSSTFGQADAGSFLPQDSSYLYIAQFNCSTNAWKNKPFELRFDSDSRLMINPVVPKNIKSIMPVVFGCYGHPDSPLIKIGRSIVAVSNYPGTFIDLSADPYVYLDDIIFGIVNSKYIKIGDFGGVLACDITISQLAISGKEALPPLQVNPIYASKYNMPVINVSSLSVSSDGDVWMSGDNRILFYDSKRDSVFEATSGDFYTKSRLSTYITGSVEVNKIFFDKYGIFYIQTKNGSGESELIASLGGSFFTKVQLDKPFTSLRVAQNGDAIFISSDGVRKVNQFSSILKNAIMQFADGTDIGPELNMPASELLYGISVDGYGNAFSENVIYFASSVGLIKVSDSKDVSIFSKNSGIDQNVVKFVANSPSGRIFCATSQNVFEFVGNTFYRIDAYGYERSGSGIPPELDGDITGVACLSNVLVITTSQTAYFSQEVIGSGVGSLWSSRSIPRSSLSLEQNSQNSTAIRDRIKISDIDINAIGGLSLGVVPEILINGHRISNGFSLSTIEKSVVFNAPLLPSDSVSLKLRKDIMKIVDLKQSDSEIEAIGKEDRKALEVGIINGEYGCMIGGTRHHIDTWNSSLALPHDDIVLDRSPPSGKATISEVVSSNVIKIAINPLAGAPDGTDPFDAISGIDKVVISNFDNFTSDGITPSEVRPFNREILHTLTPVSNAGNLVTDIPAGYGTGIVFIKFAGDSRGKIAYSTGSPAAIFISDTNLNFEDTPSATFAGGSNDFEVSAMCSYRSKLFVAVSKRDGSSNPSLFSSSDGITFTEIAGIAGRRISGMAVSNSDNKLYIAVSGISQPSNVEVGELYSYDDSSIQVVATNLNSKANAVTCIDRFVYVGTGSPARIYRYDITGGGVEIVLSESESDVTSLATVGAGIYAGLSTSSRIMRSNNPSSEFIQSFITIPTDVIYGTKFEIDGVEVPYFSVGNILFAYSNAWSAVGRSDTDIVGACVNEFGTILYISQSEIKSLSVTVSSLRYVFVKLIDRAGNETDIRSEPDEVPTDGDGYNDNLTIRISSQSTEGQNLLVDTGLSNTLVEYDIDGTALFTLPGDSPFYSGVRVDDETGVYESQVLAGASGHVSWNTIQWTGSMPAGTDIEILLRSGSTREILLAAPYSVRFSWQESGANISFMPGMFIQFQIRMRTATDVSPRVDSLTITENAGSTSNVITTMFELPSDMRRGIITTDSQLPSGSAITAAISLKDASDFAEFQEVPIDRLFEPAPSNQGSKLRIGFKLVSPSSENSIQAPTPTGCSSLPLSLNTVQWIYDNDLLGTISADFRVAFFSDFSMNEQILSVDTIATPQLFKIDGNQFPSDGGALFSSGQSRSLSLIPTGFPFVCDTCYYIKLYASIDGAEFSQISPLQSAFKKQCGVNFLDVVSFSYQNRAANGRFHFRISLYDDLSRNNLVQSFFSYYSTSNWTVDGFNITSDGVSIATNQTKLVEFVIPRVENIESEKTYYITIQAYNLDDPGAGFSFNDTSYSLRLRSISDGTSCGTSTNVPVIRGFCMMFELENGQLVKMRFDG